MDFNFELIQQAMTRIEPYIVRTPLLRLQNLDAFLGCQVYVKAECMQITGAFKLRGAMNKALTLTKEELERGIVAASSGNHGRAIAYTARMLGTSATVVMPNTAPRVKAEAIRALGAEIIPCETSKRFQIAERICAERGATMIPPFNDPYVMAGQGTVGMEILDQCPEIDTVVVPVSGGGLISGVAAAVKAMSPCTKVYGAEPAALARYGKSLEAGRPVSVPQKKSIADALVSQRPGEICFPVVKANTDGVAAVEDSMILRALKLLLMEGKLLAEPSSCIGIGALLQGALKVQPEEKVCFVISGGSIGFNQLEILKDIAI